MNESVSVIIPAYNAARTIERSLRSVFSQRYPALQIIVVDDGSTDNTAQILQNNYYGVIQYVFQSNGGAAAARNRGLAEATGKYIAFLDADDEWTPDKLCLQYATMENNRSVGLSFTDMSHWENGLLVHRSYLHERKYNFVSSGMIYDQLLHECFIFTPTVMMRRDIVERVGLFDESLRISEDYDLWLRIAKSYEVLYIDTPLLNRHRSDSNLTGDQLLYAESSINMLERLLESERRHKTRKKILVARLAEAYKNAAYHYRMSGQFSKARQYYINSFMYNPSIISVRGYIASFIT